jgi:putative membrane protein insertion efficiency factor
MHARTRGWLRRVWHARLWLVIGPVRVYQLLRRIPGLNARVCRFEPTCSQYMIDAVVCFGLVKGVWAGTWRIVRCNPYGGLGDDPAEKFRWYWERSHSASRDDGEGKPHGT